MFTSIYKWLCLSLSLLCLSNLVHAATDCQSQTEIPVIECQTLVTFWQQTNGSQWQDSSNWNLTQFPCSWSGVFCENGHVTALVRAINRLSGTLPNLDGLSQLKVLSLFNNQLSGSLPAFNLPLLEDLNLQGNQFQGDFNTLNLPALKRLDISKNQLSGNLPNFDLPNLEELVLYQNQLIGSIPNFNLLKLKHLSLHGNQLSGNLPLFNQMPNLGFLNLKDNQLTGVLPAFSLRKLWSLSLGNNQLTGSLPAFNLPNLQYLSLYHNSLTGSLNPLLSLSKLVSASLNNNQFSGDIPHFYQLTLGGIDLSYNQLTGTIPDLNNLFQLVSLRLSHNQLQGSIPDLSNLLSLTWLYLDNNQLSGLIPNFVRRFDPANNEQIYLKLQNNTGLYSCNPNLLNHLNIIIPNWQSTQTQTTICPQLNRLTNLSTRALTQTEFYSVIAGFIIQGTGGCDVMIRGFGKGIGLSPNLDTQLLLQTYPDATQLVQNSSWQIGNPVAGIPAHLHLPDPSDAGIFTRLNAGAYTATMTPEGVTGIGLIGVDEVNCDAGTQLVNISTRAEDRTGAEAMIAGFTIEGEGAIKVMIRGFGSGLGLSPCLDTQVELQKFPSGDFVASNNNWQSAANSGQIPAALQLPNATDAGLLIDLPAGAYTAIMTPVIGSCNGVGLIGVDVVQ